VHCPTGVPISEKSHLVYVQITKYYQFPPNPVHCQNQVPFSGKSHLAYVPISVAALYWFWAEIKMYHVEVNFHFWREMFLRESVVSCVERKELLSEYRTFMLPAILSFVITLFASNYSYSIDQQPAPSMTMTMMDATPDSLSDSIYGTILLLRNDGGLASR
jgi:hypothetical protein